MIVHYKSNATGGRDFAVGDVHGMFGPLAEKLAEGQFDANRDRLFCTGDLVDRGPDSHEAIRWLEQPWFHTVRGNHEQMAIDYAAGRIDGGTYGANGGDWFIDMAQQQRTPYVEAFSRLPIAMEIETANGLVGVVHADCPLSDWDAFRAALDDERDKDRVVDACLWSRSRIMHGTRGTITGVHAVLVGHTPVEAMKRLGNVLYIDTGAVYRGGHLTLIELDAVGG